MTVVKSFVICFGCALVLCLCQSGARAQTLPYPNATQVGGTTFVQPNAGLFVTTDLGGGVTMTELFFSNLSGGPALPTNNRLVNILGNFQAFDENGNPTTSFQIVGVQVTVGATSFAPPSGMFDFAGNPSLTFSDSLDPDQVVFLAGDPSFAFTFLADNTFQYSYGLMVTGLPVGSFLLFDDVELSAVPEPTTLLLLCVSAGLTACYARARRRPVSEE